MVSVLALGTARLNGYTPAAGTDPGLLGLAVRAFHNLRVRRDDAFGARAAAFIEANGGSLSDDVERRLSERLVTGQF
jgi:hypothetical protein